MLTRFLVNILYIEVMLLNRPLLNILSMDAVLTIHLVKIVYIKVMLNLVNNLVNILSIEVMLIRPLVQILSIEVMLTSHEPVIVINVWDSTLRI